MVKLQENKGQYFITIPITYVQIKKWKKGQVFVLGFDTNGDLVIKEVKK